MVLQKGLDLIKKHEGLRLKAYLCPAGVPTIGYGATYYPETGAKVKLGDVITRERAEQMLTLMVADFAVRLDKVITADVNPHQFWACLSLAYNIGLPAFQFSTVCRRVNENPNNPAIREAFGMWNKITKGGKKVVSSGLTIRRRDEANLYFTPYL